MLQKLRMPRRAAATLALALAMTAGGMVVGGAPADAATTDTPFMRIAGLINREIKPWLADPQLIEAIKAQNAEHAKLTQADIDRLDKQWRAEVKAASKPLIDKVMAKPLSAFLKARQDRSKSAFTEIFVMDNKGLNVGQSEITSDYWQGDEAKWIETYTVGPNAAMVDEIEQDQSTGKLQSQVSLTITDPATGEAIGAITIGVAMEKP